MNLSLAFLHGEQALVGFIFAAVIVLLGFPLLTYVLLRYTKLSEKKLALAYFILTASTCGVFLLGGLDSAYIPLFTVFYIAFHLHVALEPDHGCCAAFFSRAKHER